MWRSRLTSVSSVVAASSCSAAFSSGGRRRLDDLDVGDAQLADALLELFEKAGVADRREPLRRVRRDERAFALHLDEQVLAHELAQRLAQRDAADRRAPGRGRAPRESACPGGTARCGSDGE